MSLMPMLVQRRDRATGGLREEGEAPCRHEVVRQVVHRCRPRGVAAVLFCEMKWVGVGYGWGE